MITADEARKIAKGRNITGRLAQIDSLIRLAVNRSEIQVMWEFHGAVRDCLGIGFHLPYDIRDIREHLQDKGFSVAVRESASGHHYLVISW